ncbi:MAG: glycosyltransferase family 2 protein [Caldisericota bacterium]|nr:glycosyltransferase family 2 protein [Caldisericota bacterium]
MLIAVIPAYNEEKNIRSVVQKTLNHADFVVVVDDGSMDNTSEEARQGGAFVIRNKVNKGKAGAMNVGFKYVLKKGADFIVVLDADGQHDPDEIPLFVNKIHEGFDIVVGARRFDRELMPVSRRLANIFSSFLTSLVAGTKILDSQSGYRIIRKSVLEKICLTSSRYQIETEMLIKGAKCGFKICFVPIKTIYIHQAQSKINQFVDPVRFVFLVVKLFFWRCK